MTRVLLTPRLWRALASPPGDHPLYRRTLARKFAPDWWVAARRYFAPLMPLGYLFLSACLCYTLTSRQVGLFVLLALVVLVLFNGSLYGAGWSARIGAEIATERERGAWDLLCMMPAGALMTVRALTAGCLHRADAFRLRYNRHLAIVRAGVVVMAALFPCSLLGGGAVLDPDLILIYASVFALLAAAYADYVQSIVLASLSGIVAGTSTRSPLDAQLWAVGGFLALQVAGYVAALVSGFVVLPLALRGVDDSLTVQLGLLLARLALFVAVREALVIALWRIAAGRLNISPAALRTLSAQPVETSPMALPREAA